MKTIIIKESNKEKINQAIKDAEGRASARTITYDDIIQDIKNVEQTLGIAKKDMVGIEVDVDHHAQNFPNAYKYTPESTQYIIRKKASGWELLSVDRYRTRREGHRYNVKLTAEAKAAIIKRMSDF